MELTESGLPGSQMGFEEALQLLEAVREMAIVMMELKAHGVRSAVRLGESLTK